MLYDVAYATGMQNGKHDIQILKSTQINVLIIYEDFLSQWNIAKQSESSGSVMTQNGENPVCKVLRFTLILDDHLGLGSWLLAGWRLVKGFLYTPVCTCLFIRQCLLLSTYLKQGEGLGLKYYISYA